MNPRNNNLYIIEVVSYNYFCLYKAVDGRRKRVRCVGDYPGNSYVKLADLLIKDCFGYPSGYRGKLPRKLRKKFHVASLLSWLFKKEYRGEQQIKICGLFISEYIENLHARKIRKSKNE